MHDSSCNSYKAEFGGPAVGAEAAAASCVLSDPRRHLETSASTHSISNIVLSALTALPKAPAGTNLQIL